MQRKISPELIRMFLKMVIILGVLFALSGVGAAIAGAYLGSYVVKELLAQNIVTPEDASIPNTAVNNLPTALSMANVIKKHTSEIGKGLTYAQMGRFAVESGDPAGTNDPVVALKNASGEPIPNQVRSTLLTATGLITSLSLSAMALGASYGAIALGLAFGLLGLALAGIAYAQLLLMSLKPERTKR